MTKATDSDREVSIAAFGKSAIFYKHIIFGDIASRAVMPLAYLFPAILRRTRVRSPAYFAASHAPSSVTMSRNTARAPPRHGPAVRARRRRRLNPPESAWVARALKRSASLDSKGR